MAINRKFFIEHVTLYLFGGRLRASQRAGLDAILGKWDATSAGSDDRWLAYMLGTAHHETGAAMQPVRETFARTDAAAIRILDRSFKAGRLPWVSKPYWRPDANGRSWLGRGYVQITHERNYERLGHALAMDLRADPDMVMRPDVALDIMFTGMREGLFTGRRLADFFAPGKAKWREARRIINGLERAELVAGYARRYHAAISRTA